MLAGSDDGEERATPAQPTTLRRVITLWPLVFYGLGVIVGAGVYVAIGEIIGRAGEAAPLSFLLAGITALLTGLCYAELASRYPEAAGAAAYVRQAFSERLAGLVALAITVSVAIAAASIASGAVKYLSALVVLPEPALIAGLVVGLTLISALGVRLSVGLAALVGLMEICGLLVAIVTGLATAPDLHFAQMIPAGIDGWKGVVAGAFIAFFAFTGFETMANLGEEVKDPRRTLALGIVLAVSASIALYVAVAVAAVLADSPANLPLLGLFEGRAAGAFALVGAIAISNGVMVEIMMLSRLFYGMAGRGQMPSWLARVNRRAQTPLAATTLAGSIVLVTALALPFEQLLVIANALTLAIFTLVDVALWRVHRRGGDRAGLFTAPRWIPPVGAALACLLIVSEFFA